MTLAQAAEELGVHYMTAYRYVRLGMLPATKSGATWVIDSSDVAALKNEEGSAPRKSGGKADWEGRLRARLLAGDEAGAWGVVEAAMASGVEPADVYERVLAPAMRAIGHQWADGALDIADEHRSTAVANRLVSRLGPRFRRRGRLRGRVIVATPPGDLHALAPAMVADIVRGAGYEVVDLGCNVPAGSLAKIVGDTEDLVAVAISATNSAELKGLEDAVGAIRAADPSVPLILGGSAVRDADHAAALGADHWAADASGAIELLSTISEAE